MTAVETEKRAGLEISLLSEDQSAMVSQIHCSSLPDDFMPSLGARFLTKYFYPASIQNPHGDVVVAVQEGQVKGFVLVTYESSKFFRWFLQRNLIAIGVAALGLLCRNSRRLWEAINIIRTDVLLPAAAEIAEIAVAADAQGQGIGAELIQYTHDLLAARGIQQCLTKTLSSNHYVIQMYQKRWQAEVVQEVQILNKSYVYLVWNVPPNSKAE